MHGRLWRNSIYARIFIKHLAQPVNFKSERYDETRVLTLHTRQISNFLGSLLLKISAFQCAIYPINVSITNAFPPESWEIPVQHKLFKYNMTYDKITPTFRQSQRQYNSVLRIIKHNLVTWDIPFALYVERRTAMLNQVAHRDWVAYVDLRLPSTWLNHCDLLMRYGNIDTIQHWTR